MKISGSAHALDHMTKMAAMPIYGENLKKSDFYETLYVALGAPAYHSL